MATEGVVHSEVDSSYVTRLKDVLDLYAEPADSKRLVVRFDETLTQFDRRGAPADPGQAGQPERYEYEYKRNGTVNLFMFLDAHRP